MEACRGGLKQNYPMLCDPPSVLYLGVQHLSQPIRYVSCEPMLMVILTGSGMREGLMGLWGPERVKYRTTRNKTLFPALIRVLTLQPHICVLALIG